MSESKEKINEIKNELESYSRYSLWVASAKAAGFRGGDSDLPFDIDGLLAKMAVTREFVLSLPTCTEQLFLFYHYIRGMSMEYTAELLGVSLRSAYRIRLRALDFAASRYFRGEKTG